MMFVKTSSNHVLIKMLNSVVFKLVRVFIFFSITQPISCHWLLGVTVLLKSLGLETSYHCSSRSVI